MSGHTFLWRMPSIIMAQKFWKKQARMMWYSTSTVSTNPLIQ